MGADQPAAQSERKAPTCAGTDRKHRDKPMVFMGLSDDGAMIWRCPRCLYIWRERGA